jgi:hypothetical protein
MDELRRVDEPGAAAGGTYTQILHENDSHSWKVAAGHLPQPWQGGAPALVEMAQRWRVKRSTQLMGPRGGRRNAQDRL